MDDTVNRAICNRRRRMGLDRNIAAAARAARSLVSGPNNSNIVRDDQDDLLKYYQNKPEEDTRFMFTVHET